MATTCQTEEAEVATPTDERAQQGSIEGLPLVKQPPQENNSANPVARLSGSEALEDDSTNPVPRLSGSEV